MPAHSPSRLPPITTANAANSTWIAGGEPARLVGAQRAAEEQRGGDIGGGDPEDRRLQMPGAQQVAREDAFQLEAVEAARIGAVMRDRAADQRLHQEQQRHHDEELHQRALAATGLPRDHLRMHVMAARDPAQIVELAERQQHRGDAAEQHHQAQRAPQQRAGRRQIADARVVREIVGVGVILRRAGWPPRPTPPR